MPLFLPSRFTGARLATVSVLCVVSACSMFGTTQPPAKKSPLAKAAGTQPYLQNMVLAHATFEQQAENNAAAIGYVTKMNKYAVQKPVKPLPVTVVELSYRTQADQKNHILLVPVIAPGGRLTDFSNLRQVTQKLAPQRPDYRAIHIRRILLATREDVDTRHGSADEVASHVNDLYQTVAESAVVPPTRDAARVQIALTRFFMHEHVRDAAYVSLENAKDLVASADDKGTTPALAQELETLENELHKKLPYTF